MVYRNIESTKVLYLTFIIFVLLLPLFAGAQNVDINAACKKAYDEFYVVVPQFGSGEFDPKDPSDPNDNICGIASNNIICPGAYETLTSSAGVACCKKVETNKTTYGCVVFDKYSAFIHTAVADATKVDLKTEDTIAQLVSNQCKEKKDVEFVPQVTIPGNISIGGKTFSVKTCEPGQRISECGILVDGSTAQKYFAVFYRFFVAALAVVAIVMVMWGGFKRIMAAGAPEKVKDANDTILGAITGLVIALLSYSLLSLVNPALVSLKTLAIEDVVCREFNLADDEGGEDITAPQNVGPLTTISGDNIVNISGEKTNLNAALALRLVAAELKTKGIKLKVSSGYRDPSEQQALINKNCPAGATSSGQCSPPTCLMINGPNACPHTSGSAVDVWPIVGGSTPVDWMWCKNNRSACGEDQSMKTLAQVMRNNGFCKLCSEPWHFEQPKVSSCCN